MIYIAADHAGFEVKKAVKGFLDELGLKYTDEGAHKFQKGDDYPIYAKAVCKKIKEGDKGILICDTGIGMSIEANRFHHIRAALCSSIFDAMRSREHNDANILVLGSASSELNDIKAMVKVFFETPFSFEKRHIKRINELS